MRLPLPKVAVLGKEMYTEVLRHLFDQPGKFGMCDLRHAVPGEDHLPSPSSTGAGMEDAYQMRTKGLECLNARAFEVRAAYGCLHQHSAAPKSKQLESH
jgi:hypothetical protein